MRISLLAICLLTFACVLPAQPQPGGSWPNAFLASGWTWTNPGVHAVNFAYAQKTRIFNGTDNFPVYSYSQVRGFGCRFQTATGLSKVQICTDYTTGLLFPVYDRLFFDGNLRITPAVVGQGGVTQAPNNVGYVIGADVLLHVNLPKKMPHWGVALFSNVSHSSVGGITATKAGAYVAFSFPGF